MPKKNAILFLLLIAFSFAVMTIQSRKGPVFSDNPAGRIVEVAQSFVDSLTDTLISPFRKISVRSDENLKLRKEVEGLLFERQRFHGALLENKRLRELLDLKENTYNQVATARVIARSIDHWSNTLVLNRGARDGVSKDMSAITPKGLAGKIIDVSERHSRLLLVTDINFSAAVRLHESRKEGILSGTGTGKCALKYIPYEEEVRPGDIVITSGLDSLFPPGIHAGYISRIDESGGDGHFQSIEVMPFQDDSRMEEVLIVR